MRKLIILAIMALLKRIDPDWKTALAGNYHPEIAMDIDGHRGQHPAPVAPPPLDRTGPAGSGRRMMLEFS